jgi:hypothetical protein
VILPPIKKKWKIVGIISIRRLWKGGKKAEG